MTSNTKIIGRECRYVGTAHSWAKGLRVKISQVLRGPTIDESRLLREDSEIGELRPDDVIEFVPELSSPVDGRRWSFVSSDACLADLEF